MTEPISPQAVSSVDLLTVRVFGLPVALQSKAQEHSDELMREMALIAEQMRQQGDTAGLPTRLVGLIDQLTGQYSMFTTEQEQQLADAVAAREESIDLTYRVPHDVAGAASALGAILDEADEFCRDGQHLLTLATPPELVDFRVWFLDQFIDQAAGGPPVSWADYRSAKS